MGAASSRKDQALAYICDYIVRKGRSPTMLEIAAALAVSDTRAKALVKKLASEQMVERTPGAQRGITVPGLMERHIVERIRAAGGKVDNDFLCPLQSLPLPQRNLSLVAIIDHIPDPQGDHHGRNSD